MKECNCKREPIRWTADIASLREGGGRLVGDCLLTAAFISYAGAFSADYRRSVIDLDVADVIAKKIPLTTPAKVESLLVTDAIVQVSSSPDFFFLSYLFFDLLHVTV